ncbi:MAG TPA: TrkH family potassium uptake protein [Luteolibacter sp.]|nr:TrkH family potassium uptake protein [Luteolibacter sp.]
MRYLLVLRMVGILLLLEAVAMACCGLFAAMDQVAAGSAAMLPLFKSAAIIGAVAAVMVAAAGKQRLSGRLLRREAVVIVGMGWLLCSAAGGVPYILCEPRMDFAAAFFESASGFTTTGSSAMTDIEIWPRGLLLWRSVTQWLGGIGILVLFVAVLSYLGVGAKSLFQNESSFRSGEAGMARIQDTSLQLIRIYLAFSGLCAVGLHLMGMSWFNAICHTMAAVSTGGFSPHNLSVGYYSAWSNGWAIELWLSLFMLLCSMNFLLFVVIVRKNWRRLHQEEDARFLLITCAVFVLAIALGRSWHGDAPLMTALRDAWFIVISIVSTTGFGTADYELWPAWAKVLLALLMFMGGCAGSTAGGIKVGRVLVFLKHAGQEVVRTFRPNLVSRLTVNGINIHADARARTVFFVAMYLVICVFSTAVVGFLEAGTGITLETCAGAVLATISNIGPGFGSVGPTENFGHFRDTTHLFLGWLMILGRLELFALLVLFFPSAWRRY